MYSEHNNHHEDRRFKFGCRSGNGAVGGNCCGACEWIGYPLFVNKLDKKMRFTCPSDKPIVNGIKSEHNNHNEDRVFTFYCCSVSKILKNKKGKNI